MSEMVTDQTEKPTLQAEPIRCACDWSECQRRVVVKNTTTLQIVIEDHSAFLKGPLSVLLTIASARALAATLTRLADEAEG